MAVGRHETQRRVTVSDYSAPGLSAPNIKELREASISNTKDVNTVDKGSVNSTALTLIENLRAEKAEALKKAEQSLPATKEKVTEEGYLYHFAGQSARESIDKIGLRASADSDSKRRKDIFFPRPKQ